jgi:hypothetical protein
MTPAIEAVSALAFGWINECLCRLGAPERAVEMLAACAQVTGTHGDDLRALVQAVPELDVAHYMELYWAGTLELDWRQQWIEDRTRPTGQDPDRAFTDWLDQTHMFYGWWKATSWATALLGARLDRVYPWVERADLRYLVEGAGDGIVQAGLRSLDDITEEVLTAIGCGQDRFSRHAVVSLALGWEGSIEDLVENAPRLVFSPERLVGNEGRSDGLYWVGIWDGTNPVDHPAPPNDDLLF